MLNIEILSRKEIFPFISNRKNVQIVFLPNECYYMK